jgi:hypothetical protein
VAWPVWATEAAPGTNVANVEGAGWSKGLYRPEKGCIMRCNRDTFCAVCNEAMEGNFFRYIDLLPVLGPRVNDIVLWQGESVDVRILAIDLLRQPPEGLKSRLDLYLDGDKVASSDRGEVAFQFRSATDATGIHQLGANLSIQSDAVRRDFGCMSRNCGWRVTVLPHKKPEIVVKPRVSVSTDGAMDVPIKVKHAKPALFKLTMAHAPSGAGLEIPGFGQPTQPRLARRHDRNLRHGEQTVRREEQQDNDDFRNDGAHVKSSGVFVRPPKLHHFPRSQQGHHDRHGQYQHDDAERPEGGNLPRRVR